jgi:methyl-accepting chemotaxis protein
VDHNTVIFIFVIVAAVAIVLQTGILFALYKALRESSTRIEGIAGRIEKQATPLLATAHTILEDARPKIAEITTNLVESTATMREHVAQVGEATTEIVERVRLQAVRLDEFVTGAANKLEATSEMIQTSVLSPMRRVRAIVQALSAGLNFLRAHRAHKKAGATEVEDEEMFI